MTDFPMPRRGNTSTKEAAGLAQRLTTAERQIKAADQQKSKQTSNEKALTEKLLKSLTALVGTLKDDLDGGNYDGMVDEINKWEGKASADLKELDRLGQKSPRLTEVVILIANIISIRDDASNI